MHGQHPEPAIGSRIICAHVLGLLLGNHVRASATPLNWPTETGLALTVGHLNDIEQA